VIRQTSELKTRRMIASAAKRPKRFPTYSVTDTNATSPTNQTVPRQLANHLENSKRTRPTVDREAESHQAPRANWLDESQSATDANMTAGATNRGQPLTQGTSSLAVAVRPRLMTRTCPVDTAEAMALKKDHSAGNSNSPASAKENLAYADSDSDEDSLMPPNV